MQLPRVWTLAAMALALAVELRAAADALQFNQVNGSSPNAGVEARSADKRQPKEIEFSADQAGDFAAGGSPVGEFVALSAQDYQLSALCQPQKWTIKQKKAASMWIGLSAYSLPESDQLVLVAGNGKEAVVTRQGSGAASAAVPGAEVVLEYRPGPACSPSAGGSFAVAGVGVRFSKEWNIKKEAVCGNTNSMKNARCFRDSGDAKDQEMYATSQAVIRTERVREDNRIVVCTAWLWGNQGHIVTNNHCFSSQEMVDNAAFHLGVEAASCSGSCQPGTCPIAKEIKGAGNVKFIKSDPTIDIALLQLTNGASEVVSKFGYLKIRFGFAKGGEQIYIPQHPNGGARQIAKTDDDNDAAIATIRETDLSVRVQGKLFTGLIGYPADTETGSSGSPVIARGTNHVVGLHRIGNCNNAGTPSDKLLAYLATPGLDNDGAALQ
ncbi:hypothetical protein P43SY_005079 [Pythium insidiosum]|uniref:Serine protease n=1 Tax=Pythium insidiosum TaxID=114742 RepID=A0AAD5Q6Z2_PYTIN|nr:hypothetical protein P43SY_005079 [Pythium insidiosum]